MKLMFINVAILFFLCFTINLSNCIKNNQNIMSLDNSNLKGIKNINFNENSYSNNLKKKIFEKTSNHTNSTIMIESIETRINLQRDNPDAIIIENTRFKLTNGIYDTIIKKVSLGGTSSKHFGFKLSSSDVKLKNAKIVNNCYETHSIYEHPYICIVVNFEPIDIINKSQIIEIEYEYTSENILRKRIKPFSKDEEENILIWIYDNFNINTDVERVNLQINFGANIKSENIIAYPEKYSYIKYNELNLTTIEWGSKEIKANQYQNYAINMPLFNSNCRLLNDNLLELSTFSVIQYVIWIFIFLMIISTVVYFYCQKGYVIDKDIQDDSYFLDDNSITKSDKLNNSK